MGSRTVFGLCLVFVAALLAGAALAGPQGKDKKGSGKGVDANKKNDKPGRARWEWTLGEGKKAEKGTFRGYHSGEIFHAERQIGTYTMEGKKAVKAEFTAGRLKGTAHLQLLQAKPAVYVGDLVRPDGQKEKLYIKVLWD
jgi:hypothetical protein